MYKILIAEDESKMRDLLIKYIKREEPDMEVVGGAENGREALQMACQYHPDIVITDISMPVMDGLAFLQETAKRKLPLKAVIISGYDEFEYARKAITLGVSEYLLKPFDPGELKEVLEKIRKELGSQKVLLDNMQLLKEKADGAETMRKEQMLRDVLAGKGGEWEPDPEVLDPSADFYCICLLKLPLYVTAAGWNLEKQENIEELVQILSGGYIHKEIQVQGLGFESNGAILILSGNASEKQHFFYKVRSSMEHMLKSMEKYYQIHAICIIGGIYQTWRMLSQSYEETLKEWRGLASAEEQMIICRDIRENESRKDFRKDVTDFSRRIKSLKEQILLSVRMGQEREAMEYLDALIQVYASISPGKTDFVAISAEELVYGIFNEMEQEGIQMDPLRSNEEMQRQIKEQLRNVSLLEIRALLEKYFAMFHQSFLENRERQQVEVMVEHLKGLIESNLEMEDLSLEWIAEQVHFSSTYVRQIFKQKTGERIMEYVIRKRMEKAGELLKKTNMKIQDVAMSCGYSNQRYFASSFKKYYGCTPTEYRLAVAEERWKA